MKDTSVEIDVISLLKKVWDNKIPIVVIGTIFAVLAFLASSLLITPKYDATTRVYVVGRQAEANNLSVQDLQAGTYLVNDYKEIITSKSVLGQVIRDNKLSESVGSLAGKLSVSIPTDTRVISITVRDANAAEAARLANAIREVAAEKIKEVTRVEDVTVLEEAETPDQPSSPNVRRNTVLAFLAGVFLTVLIVVVRNVLDDRIKRPEDIEETLGLPLLGIVPMYQQGK